MTQENLVVRHVQPGDWSALYELSKIELDSFGKDGLTPLNLSLFARGGILLGLFLDGEIVGEAQLLSRANSGGAFLFGLAVAQQCQGRGYGKFLLQQVIEELKNEGCQWVELTVAAENEVARHLYENSFGFRQIALIPGEGDSDLSPDASSDEPRLVLRKELCKAVL